MVQAELTNPKDNMTSHSTATDTQEHQPGEGMDSFQYFSGKILEVFQGNYIKSVTLISLCCRKRVQRGIDVFWVTQKVPA